MGIAAGCTFCPLEDDGACSRCPAEPFPFDELKTKANTQEQS